MEADPTIWDSLYTLWLEVIWRPLKNPSNNGALMAVLAALGLAGAALGWTLGLFKRKPEPGLPINGPTVVMPLADHESREARYRADLETRDRKISELMSSARGDELDLLRQEKAEIATRLQDVTKTLEERDKRIQSLEADLTAIIHEAPVLARGAMFEGPLLLDAHR